MESSSIPSPIANDLTRDEIQRRWTFGKVQELSFQIDPIYPEHSWDMNKMKSKPLGYWSIKENQRRFMDELGKKLGVTRMDDWYDLTQDNIQRNGGLTIEELSHYKCFLDISCHANS